MNKYLTRRQFVFLACLYVLSGNILLGGTALIKNEYWMAPLLSMGVAIPIAMIYARLMVLYPETDLVGILTRSLGGIAGKIVLAFVVFFAMTIAVLHLSFYSFFVQIVALEETPNFMVLALFIFVCGVMAGTNLTTLGKWSSFMFVPVVAVTATTFMLSIGRLKPENLLPIGAYTAGEYLQSTLMFYANNIGDVLVLLFLASSIKRGEKVYRLNVQSVFWGTFLLLVIALRNILTIGFEVIESRVFPAYAAASLVQIGDVLNRIEVLIMMNFIIALLVKISVCLFASSVGISAFFKISDYKKLILPVCLLLFSWTLIEFKSILELLNFAKIYYKLALPFQVLLPTVVWIAAEIRRLAAKKSMQ